MNSSVPFKVSSCSSSAKNALALIPAAQTKEFLPDRVKNTAIQFAANFQILLV